MTKYWVSIFILIVARAMAILESRDLINRLARLLACCQATLFINDLLIKNECHLKINMTCEKPAGLLVA